MRWLDGITNSWSSPKLTQVDIKGPKLDLKGAKAEVAAPDEEVSLPSVEVVKQTRASLFLQDNFGG